MPMRHTESVPARRAEFAPARHTESVPARRAEFAPARHTESVPARRAEFAPARRTEPARPRRAVAALSASVLTTVLLGTTVLGTAVAAAAGNPSAEVSPRTVAPGGTVTVSVSVSCEPTGGPAPETIDATSQAFEHGTVQLRKTSGKETDGGRESTGGTGDRESAGGREDTWGKEREDTWGKEKEDAWDKEEARGGPAVYSGTARIAPAANFEAGGRDGGGKTSEWSVDGVCPAAPGGQGRKWSASFTVILEKTHDSSRGTTLDHGVRAGEGGTFTDSTIALVTGGVLIAGAAGAAVHRLRRRGPSSNG